MKQFTDITVLLDRSGSMHFCKDVMERAYDKFIEGHRANPTTRVTLIQFNSKDDQQVVYQSVPVGSVEKLDLQPSGDTPLLDATCQMVDNLGKRYSRLPESERPDQVLVVIITDGQENSSKIYKRRDVRKRIEHQSQNYNWQFIYLGANQDAFKEAESLGIERLKTIAYDIESTGVVMDSAMANTVAYASLVGSTRSLKSSADETLNWTEEQRSRAKK